jgi:hypothetical protein
MRTNTGDTSGVWLSWTVNVVSIETSKQFPQRDMYPEVTNIYQIFYSHKRGFTVQFLQFLSRVSYVHVSVHHNLCFRQPTRCSSKQSLFILLRSHSTRFGCLPHPSSGVHKLVTTTGASHAVNYKGIM